jgi:hypothetical protein
MPTEKIVARYKQDHEGSYLGGVPARDLTEEDFAALPDEQKALVRLSPLYTLTESAEKEAASAERRAERAETAAAKAES